MWSNQPKENLAYLYNENLELSSLNEEEWKHFLEIEESTFACMKFLQSRDILQSGGEFSMDLELELFNSESPAKLPLPQYLQKYIDISFETQKSNTESVSFVIKLAKEGLKLLTGGLDPNFTILPKLDSVVRSKEIDATQTVNLEEKQDPFKIQYQITKENEKEVYLSFHFPKEQKNPYEQVILKRNNRFIYSSQIGGNGIVSFSGLQEGRYLIEFLGKKLSKSIDITVLLDHP